MRPRASWPGISFGSTSGKSRRLSLPHWQHSDDGASPLGFLPGLNDTKLEWASRTVPATSKPSTGGLMETVIKGSLSFLERSIVLLPEKSLSAVTPHQEEACSSGLRRAGWNAEGPGLFLMVCGVVLGLLLTGGWPGAGRCQSPGPRLPHPQVKKADYTLVSICCSMIPSQGSTPRKTINVTLFWLPQLGEIETGRQDPPSTFILHASLCWPLGWGIADALSVSLRGSQHGTPLQQEISKRGHRTCWVLAPA